MFVVNTGKAKVIGRVKGGGGEGTTYLLSLESMHDGDDVAFVLSNTDFERRRKSIGC